MNKTFIVELRECTYIFYKEIAEYVSRPIEEILSDTLYKYADIVMRNTEE